MDMDKDRLSAKKPRTTATNSGNRTTTSTAPKEEQKAEESTPNHKRSEAAGVDSTKDGNGNMTLADPNLLDCPICSQPLCSPVYQCKNGHIACASCCTTILKNKCSICCLAVQNIRNTAIEKVLDSVRVTCQHKSYGCPEVLSYSYKRTHDKACNYVPCSCPCCDFVGNSKCLYDHFALQHKGSSREFYFGSKAFIYTTNKHVILREGTKGVLFILNCRIETLGNFYNVVCVAPPASEKISYELVARTGVDSITLRSSVEMTSKWTEQTPSKIRFVYPTKLVSVSELFRLELIIGKKPAPS